MAIQQWVELSLEVQEDIVRYLDSQAKALGLVKDIEGGLGLSSRIDTAGMKKLFDGMTANDQETILRGAAEFKVKGAPVPGTQAQARSRQTPATGKAAPTEVRINEPSGAKGAQPQPTKAATKAIKAVPKVARVKVASPGVPISVTQLDDAAAIGVESAAGATTEAGVVAELGAAGVGGAPEGTKLAGLIDILEDGKYASRPAQQRSASAVKRWYLKALSREGGASRDLARKVKGLSVEKLFGEGFAKKWLLGKDDPARVLWERAHTRIGGVQNRVLRHEFKRLISLIEKASPGEGSRFLVQELKKLGPEALFKVGARRGIETIATIKEGGVWGAALRDWTIKGPRPQIGQEIMEAAAEARGAATKPGILKTLAAKIPFKRLRGWVQGWGLADVAGAGATTDPTALAALRAAGARVPSKASSAFGALSGFKALGVVGAGAGILYEGYRLHEITVGARAKAERIRQTGVNPETGEQLFSVGALKDRLRRAEALSRRRQLLVQQPDLFAQVMSALGNDSPSSGGRSMNFGAGNQSPYEKALGQRLGKSDYSARLDYLLSQMDQ